MKKYLLKIIGVMLAVVTILFTMTISAYGYNIYTYDSYANYDNVLLLNNKSTAYLIGTNYNQVYLQEVYPQNTLKTLTLNSNAKAYNLFNNHIVMVCPNKEYNQSEIVIYSISNDSFKSFNIPDINVNDGCKIGYTNGNLYYIDSQMDIVQFSDNGKYIKKFSLDYDVNSLVTDYNGNLYATSLHGLYKLNQNGFVNISGETFYQQSRFVADNTFVNSNGYFYNISGNSVNKLSDFKSYSDYPSGGIYNNYIIAPYLSTLYAIDKNNDSKKKSVQLSDNIVQTCVISDTIIALTYTNNIPAISHIPFNNLKDIVDNSNLENNDGASNGISSSTYTINNSSYKITNIQNSTTVSQFKKNISYDGYNIEFYKSDGKSFTSGNVGTGTTVKFQNGSSSYVYTLSVIGDLTGEGNVNSRDKQKMFDYLLDNTTLEGVFIDSANLDKNNNVSVSDLVLLLRLIKENTK